jgi:O-acetyl-ADP-ribose deacetylase (regulator of RNase III)
MLDLTLLLVDPSEALCREWRKAFEELPRCEVVQGRFETLAEFDCMVAAGNSFGLMDGGVDAAITRFFGPELMARVQRRILDEFLGEQPVGTSMIVETGHAKHPLVAHTPTMRHPMPIAKTDYPYTAMRAALLAVRRHNGNSLVAPIRRLACPGLGTGTGRVTAVEAARQMALAYRSILAPPSRLNWDFASRRQSELRVGGDMGFLLGATDRSA